jgi:hypothetical protein
MIALLCMLIKVLLAPFTALGLAFDVAFGSTTGTEAWEWLGDNEWFGLAMVVHMFLIAGAIEVLL